MLILMHYVHWVFKRAQILTPMLTRVLNLPIIYLVRQQQRLQESHKRRGCGNHQGHLHRKREEDAMKMKEEKEEAAMEYEGGVDFTSTQNKVYCSK